MPFPVPSTSSRIDDDGALIRSLITGLTVFRVACMMWLAAVLIATRTDIARPVAAWALTAGAGALTIAWVVRLQRRGPHALLTPRSLVGDIAAAVALSVGDGVVYDGPHPLSLGSAWPLASVFSVGVARGTRGGATAGALVGIGRAVGDLLETGSGWSFDETLARISTLFLYMLAGAMAGFATRRLVDAETQIALGRARDEVARTLHDGVLQTLAMVQRRSEAPDLVRLARDQERELREYLFGAGIAVGGGELGAVLRRVASRCEDRDGVSVSVVVTDTIDLHEATTDALGGAVGEAITNAAKHGQAARITVYAEVDEAGGVFCSVKDDGIGFDPATTTFGVGLTASIVDRVTERGGRVEIAGNPGSGAEIRLWI